MALSPLAGKPAPKELLVDVARSMRAFDSRVPDLDDPAQRVSLRHQRSSRLVAHGGVHTGAHPRDHAGDLRLPARRSGTSGPLFLGKDTHALSGPAQDAALEVLAAQRRRDRLPAGRRLHADAGDLPRDPRAQPRPHGAHRGRHRDHAVAQPAGGRRLQVQPAERRPGRLRRRRRGSRTAPTSCSAKATGTCGASPLASALQAPTTHARDFVAALRRGSAERHRHGGDPRGRTLARRRSARRRRRRLLGADQSRCTVSTSPSSTRRWIRRSRS